MTTFIHMIIYFKNKLKRVVFYAFFINLSVSWAGSYEDFFQATQRDQVQVVSNLLSRGFDPNTVNVNAEPAIFDAWDHGALKVLESLIRHPNTKLNVKNSHGESLLMLVCLKGQINMAKLMISRQADVNQPGWTPLHYAATGGHTSLIQLLLEESAYIDAESPNGTTPLMMAARYGNAKVTQLLIDEGADVSVKNQLGLTAMDFAIQGARPDSVRVMQLALEALDASDKAKSRNKPTLAQ
jgi:ankyrin repeat protein